MARNSKSPIMLVLILVLVIGAFAYYAYNSEGFQSLDCAGVTCDEGKFCQKNTCHDIYPPETNDY